MSSESIDWLVIAVCGALLLFVIALVSNESNPSPKPGQVACKKER